MNKLKRYFIEIGWLITGIMFFGCFIGFIQNPAHFNYILFFSFYFGINILLFLILRNKL